MSPTNVEVGAVFTIMVACLALIHGLVSRTKIYEAELRAIMKYQVKQLNKIEFAATAIGINEDAGIGKKRQVRECV